MRRKHNRTIAIVTLFIMTLVLLIPMYASAAPEVPNPPDVEEGGARDNYGIETDDNAPADKLKRTPIRVLEVYPSKIKNNEQEYMEISKEYKNNNNFEITSMSLNRFISLKDEINGKYDIVYFGKGRYFRNAVDEHRYGNDITKLAADKVIDYINSNQYCIFHEDAFTTDKVDSNQGVTTIMRQELYNYRNRSNVVVVTDSNKKNVFKNLRTTYTNYNVNPILQVTEFPKAYDEKNDDPVSNKLTFKFKVYDPDTPIDSKLKVVLYIDRNNDSLFEEKEIAYAKGNEGDLYTLEVMNGRSGTINFSMPRKLTGVYFWKLVVKDSKNAKSEEENVFKLVGDEIEVNVLQVVPNNGGNLKLRTKFNENVQGGMPGQKYGYKAGEYKINIDEWTVNTFKNKSKAELEEINTKYDMIILGFDDDYSVLQLPFSNNLVALNKQQSNAIEQMKSFIDTKKAVMFTHDSIHFHYNDDLTYNFVEEVGQVIKWDNTKGYSEDDLQAKDMGIWSAGLLTFDCSLPTPMDDQYNKLNNDYQISDYAHNNPNKTANRVAPVNSTAITLYPFNLEDPGLTRAVSGTHYQWRKLDLEDPDVIPLFNLYNNSAKERVNDDSMNNYYTYSKGNITYSGTGHSSSYPEYEIKLFVNTAIKAYSMGNHAPDITVIEPQNNDRISKEVDNFELRFTAFDIDLGDDKLNYKVSVDYTDDGVANFVDVPNGSGQMWNWDDEVSLMIDNKEELGKFVVRIEVDDNNAMSREEITLYKVDDPIVKPSIAVYKGETQIDKCLVGEVVTARITFDITGRSISSSLYTYPSYNMVKEYYNLYETEGVTQVGNGNLGQITFYPNTLPSPTKITKNHPISIDTGLDDGTLDINATVGYQISGVNQTKTANGKVLVRNGQVGVYVKDDTGNAIKEAIVKDANTDVVIGQTDVNGYLKIDRVYGTKRYTIESPDGYIYDGEYAIYKYDASNNKVSVAGDINLTYDDYKWEVQFKVQSNLGMSVTYYKPNAMKTSMNLIEPNAGVYEVKNHKNTIAYIVGKVTVDSMSSSELREIKFDIITKDVDGHEVTDVQYKAVICDGAEGFSVPDLVGITQLKKENVIASGSYAGEEYYILIKVNKSNTQKIEIKKATLKIVPSAGVSYEREVELNTVIKLNETSVPMLK